MLKKIVIVTGIALISGFAVSQAKNGAKPAPAAKPVVAAAADTPIKVELSLEDCLKRADGYSLQAVMTKLRAREYDLSYDTDWWKTILPDLGYEVNYAKTDEIDETDYETVERRLYDHDITFAAHLFSDEFLTAIQNQKSVAIRKEILETQFKAAIHQNVRNYYAAIVLKTEYLGKLEDLVEELGRLRRAGSGLSGTMDAYLKGEIDRYVINAKEYAADYRTDIKWNKIRLLNLLNYPVSNDISFTDSLNTIAIDYDRDLKACLQNSIGLRTAALNKISKEREILNDTMGLLPRIYARVTTEAEEVYFGIEAMLNTSASYLPVYMGNFDVNLVGGIAMPEFTKTTYNGGEEIEDDPNLILDKLYFQFGLAISSNQIIDALESRALDKNQLSQIDQDIKIRTADLIERLQGRIMDMEYYQTDISTAKDYQEVSNRQFQLVSGAMRPDDLSGVQEAVSVISRRLYAIVNLYNGRYNQYSAYHQYLSAVEGAY